jgi:hypothetical protein
MIKDATYSTPLVNLGDPTSNVIIRPTFPTVSFTDASGTSSVDFMADSVTVNNDGGTVLTNAFITNVAITDNLLFEADTEQTRTAIEHSIAASIQGAIDRGDIVCDGSTRFDVRVDTSATSSNVYRNDLAMVNNYRFRFGPAEPMTAEERAKWHTEQAKRQAKWAAEQKRRDFKRAIKQQLAPAIINHRGDKVRAIKPGANFNDAKQNEIVALGLLRSMVDKDVFKKYLRHGFVTIVGQSGLTYQIQRKSHIVKVWKQGVLVSTLCVYVKDQHIPPTDDVVAKILMCRYAEKDIWDGANVSWRVFDANIIGEATEQIGIPLPTQRSNFVFGQAGVINARPNIAVAA